MEQRVRLSADQRRAQLLGVAGALFAQHGYHGLSMEQLADAAGVSKPVLYQHFPSKRDLYLALVRDAASQLQADIRAALEGTVDNRARVEGAIAAWFDGVEDPRYRLLFTADLADEEVRAAIDDAMRGVSERIGRLIAHDAGLDATAAAFLAEGVRGLATAGSQWWLQARASEGCSPGAPGPAALSKGDAVRLLARLAWRGLGSFGP